MKTIFPASFRRRHGAACSLLFCLLFLITAAAGAAATAPGAVPIQRTLPPAPVTSGIITCQAPCTCMESARAAIAWGPEGFTQCNATPCGYSSTAAGAPIAQYCLRQKTTTVAPLRPEVTLTALRTVVIPVSTGVPVATLTGKVPVQPVTQIPGGICPGDSDCDGRPDSSDNCPAVSNPDQQDADSTILWSTCTGTACKMPAASDLMNCEGSPGTPLYENCMKKAWEKANPGSSCLSGLTCQHSTDNAGNACDTCWQVRNPEQADSDGDCAVIQQNASFWDGKKWLQDPRCGDSCDNCAAVANPDQIDTNNDGKGDACSCPWCTDTKIRPVVISGLPEDKIDIVLIPSSTGYDMEYSVVRQRDDYNKTEPVFRAVVLDNIRDGYFRLDQYSTSPVPADFRQRFNFYYYWDPTAPADAHSSCSGTLPAGFDTAVPFRDAAIILYPRIVTSTGSFPIGGCSAGFGIPAQITAPGFWPPTLLHESGHGIFGLVDTYCSRPGIDTSYIQNDPYSNVWTSGSGCTQAPDSPDGTLDPAHCRRIEADDPATPKNPDCSIDFWRHDPDPDDMRDCDFTSRFGTASVRRIDYVLGNFTGTSGTGA